MAFSELLLVKMMRHTAEKCPDDDHDFMVKQLRLDQSEINMINNDEMFNKQEKLLKLFARWRKK